MNDEGAKGFGLRTSSPDGAPGSGRTDLPAAPIVAPANADGDPPPHVQGPLRERWQTTVGSLATIGARPMPDGLKERHQIYSLLVMALVSRYWNGNKRGSDGEYPWRERQRKPNGTYEGGQYLGHNIACVAVDGAGELIDFDFNHNEILSSSAEHAESRLVRRVFSLVQIYDNWETRDAADLPRSVDYSNILSNVTIYTSLESCSQCAGIMALGRVKEVVYLQRDPGMYCIGNILFNLTDGTKLPAPYPIPASDFDLKYFSALEEGYAQFQRGVADRPFFRAAGTKADASPSITSFLCTDIALDIFARAEADFRACSTRFPDFKPPSDTDAANAKALSNAEALQHARRFFEYAYRVGRRGTPHKL